MEIADFKDFERHVHTHFDIARPEDGENEPFEPDEGASMELIEARLGPGASGQDGQQSFSLLFRPTPNVAPEQGIYILLHRDLGRVPLFLVPISDGAGGFSFEAIVNRLA